MNTAHQTQSNLYNFNAYKQNQSISDNNDEILIEKIMDNPNFEEYIRNIVEGSIYSYLANNISKSFKEMDDPFDSIYIADLKKDSINIDNMSNLSKNIKDKSDELFIDDGLDD